ncbi:fluoride efflux transporter FluC [Halobacterium salinarum]|uniref:fluoride efflux transporter FluC n=1 Tax=Halobacterium salinarum TaxID=2242 RepID=UPI001F3D73ED|nr:CrcB family protein [Halobacterium salinarum]MCF2166177.1 CrcB family protein [Halobacterium salinarum]MCF2167660.1 CrcB family protein [Halobacterium salinarum]
MTGAVVPPAVLVAAGGALGAVLRWRVVAATPTTEYPAGTLVVNVVGSFVLAALTFAAADADTMLLFGTGACGAFTTFASFSVDVVALVDADRPVAAAGHALGNLLGAGLAVALAWLLVA